MRIEFVVYKFTSFSIHNQQQSDTVQLRCSQVKNNWRHMHKSNAVRVLWQRRICFWKSLSCSFSLNVAFWVYAECQRQEGFTQSEHCFRLSMQRVKFMDEIAHNGDLCMTDSILCIERVNSGARVFLTRIFDVDIELLWFGIVFFSLRVRTIRNTKSISKYYWL